MEYSALLGMELYKFEKILKSDLVMSKEII
jgi:hypothetical protein